MVNVEFHWVFTNWSRFLSFGIGAAGLLPREWSPRCRLQRQAIIDIYDFCHGRSTHLCGRILFLFYAHEQQ